MEGCEQSNRAKAGTTPLGLSRFGYITQRSSCPRNVGLEGATPLGFAE